MSVEYTWDVLCTVDGYGAYTSAGAWGGFWGKQGPEFLARRAAQFAQPQRMVFGANTFRQFQRFHGSLTPASESDDPINTRMKHLPATVISSTMAEPLDWPDATLARGDAVEVVARLKKESALPLRSHGSPTLNRALLAAGLVDRIQLTVFPVVSGRTGDVPMLHGAPDLDLELTDSVTLDAGIQEVTYRPHLHSATQ